MSHLLEACGAADLLEALGIADADALADFDNFARMAKLVTGAPQAFVSFADASRLWPATAGPREPFQLEVAYCAALLAGEEDTLVTTDVRADPRTRAIAGRLPHSPVLSYAGALLKTEDGRRLGTLCVTDDIARPLGEEQVRLLKGLARQVMTLVSLRAAKRELTAALAEMTVLARTDGLTGLLNRRAFHEEAEGLRKLVLRERGVLSLALLDIDHFKRINDLRGHEAGDAVLREVGALLRAELRSTDRVGRIGGEEFAIAMPFTTPQAAAGRMDQLRQRIAQHMGRANGDDLPITVSGGVAALQARDASIDAVLRRADQALYRAKESGRNRVLVDPAIKPHRKPLAPLQPA